MRSAIGKYMHVVHAVRDAELFTSCHLADILHEDAIDHALGSEPRFSSLLIFLLHECV